MKLQDNLNPNLPLLDIPQDLCAAQIEPRKYVLDQAAYTIPTRQHGTLRGASVIRTRGEPEKQLSPLCLYTKVGSDYSSSMFPRNWYQ